MTDLTSLRRSVHPQHMRLDLVIGRRLLATAQADGRMRGFTYSMFGVVPWTTTALASHGP